MKKDVTWILAASHSTESGRLGTYSSLTGASDSPAPQVCLPDNGPWALCSPSHLDLSLFISRPSTHINLTICLIIHSNVLSYLSRKLSIVLKKPK